MALVSSAEVIAGRGISTENRKAGKREITFLSDESWADACRELNADLPWHARRANLLTNGVDLNQAIGRIVTIGQVRIHIHGETKPCKIMDEQCLGLRVALEADCRGGVYGQVLTGGMIRVGDAIKLES